MVDPVVSSRFGTRPLLDIPAMQVSSTSYQEVPSIQHHVPRLRLDTYDTSGLPRQVTHVPRPYHTAPPPHPLEPTYHDHYHPREYSHYYGPHGEVVKPSPYYLHPHEKYPGVHVPYTAYHPLPPPPPPAVLHPPPAPAPPPMYHVRAPPPGPYDQRPQTFDVTCELDYGRVAHISVRESHGHFRGIPEYLRRELMKTYGRYPFMEVKIRFENGDYHIYANHDKRPAHARSDSNYDGRSRHRHHRNPPGYEEENDYYDDRSEQRPDNDDDMSDGVRPREMGAPRGILRERGWNSYR